MGIKNILLCGVGFLLLGMGAIGLVLPLWPTTPFVLAAAGCFASTPRIYEKVIKIPFFSEYIRNYKDRKGLKPETVIISLTSLWGMLLLSGFHIQKPWVLIILAVVGISVTTHILWIAKARNK